MRSLSPLRRAWLGLQGHVDRAAEAQLEAAARAQLPTAHAPAWKPTLRQVLVSSALLTVAALVGLGVTGAVWLVRYQPLDMENAYGFGYAAGHRPLRPVVHDGYSLTNGGRVAVRVTRIDLPPGMTVRLGAGDPADGGEPFRPFDLEPGGERMILGASSLPICRTTPQRWRSLGEITVHFEVFGIDRETALDIAFGPRFAREDRRGCIAPAEPQ